MEEEMTFCSICGKYTYSDNYCKRCTDIQKMKELKALDCSEKEKVLQYCNYRKDQIDSDEIKAAYQDVICFVKEMMDDNI